MALTAESLSQDDERAETQEETELTNLLEVFQHRAARPALCPLQRRLLTCARLVARRLVVNPVRGRQNPSTTA